MGLTGSRKQIVLAEDNPGDVGLVREALREHNVSCDLRVMSDGAEVLEFFDRLDRETETPCPDLILLDLHLPKHNGDEVLDVLQASERCRRTPVVLLTSVDGVRDEKERLGSIHYFRKTPSLDQFMQLGRVIKEIIHRAKPR
jgi:chemotaxis family two-component system response regulator Rcp1